MLLPSVRRLALADIDADTLRDLVDHGESLYVERKVQPPTPPRFGAAAASFANMLGGFILLGVKDDGEVVGWDVPDRLDIQSHLGSLLREEVDPLPPFTAKRIELDDKSIGVVRVFESSDSPHVVRGSGAIYVRSSKGKEPIPVDDHQTILAMAKSGREAVAEASARLAGVETAKIVFGTPDSGSDREYEGAEVVARAAPLTMTPTLSDWPLTRRAAEVCEQVAEELVPAPRAMPQLAYRRDDPQLIPLGRAFCTKVVQEGGSGSATEGLVLADSGGVLAAGLRRSPARGDRPSFLINRMLDDELRPLANAISSLLEHAEAVGRAVVDVWVLMGAGGTITGHAHTLIETIHVSRELTTPATEDEVEALAQQWHREIQRAIGIVKFEG